MRLNAVNEDPKVLNTSLSIMPFLQLRTQDIATETGVIYQELSTPMESSVKQDLGLNLSGVPHRVSKS